MMKTETGEFDFLVRPAMLWPLFICFFLLLFVFKLDSGGLYSPQEARSGLIARNMIESGNMLDMYINGDETLQKPVFSYWLTVGTMKLFGDNELGVRLPSTIAALITLIVTFLLGRDIYGRKQGVLAMFMLGTMISFVHLSRIARIDIVLTALFTTSLYLFYKGYVEHNRPTNLLYVFYIVLGLSVLTKGPVTVALAGMIIIAYCIKEKNWKILWEIKPISGVIIGIIITMPWFLYENYRTGGQFFSKFFLSHNVERFLGLKGEFGKKKPIWFYIPQLIAGALPWSFFLISALVVFRKKIVEIFMAPLRFFNKTLSTNKKSAPFSNRTNFLLFWFLVVFVFFSLSAFKRKDYLLPLYPPLSILIAHYAISFKSDNADRIKKGFVWCISILGTLFATVIGLILSGVPQKVCGKILETQTKMYHINTKDAFMIVRISEQIQNNLIITILVLTGILAFVYFIGTFFRKGENLRGAYTMVGLAALLLTTYELTFKPLKDEAISTKGFIEAARNHIEPGKKAVFYKMWNLEAAYYLRKSYDRYNSPAELNGRAFASGPESVYKYIIIEKKFYNKLNNNQKENLTILEEMNDRQRKPLVFCKFNNLKKPINF